MKLRNPLSGLFARSPTEEYLARYIVREYRGGRSLSAVLEDPYVRNRSSPEQRARLFERPEVVRAIGEEAAASLARLTAEEARQASTASTSR
jgi:hypothetical protein